MNSPIFAFITALTILGSMMAFPQRVHADDAAIMSEQLSQRMRQHQVVEGHFEQWRTLTGIPHPIHSNGRFIYWRDHGLYWETTEPIAQASTFTPDVIIHWQSSSSTQKADRNSSPVQKQISRILLAVFGGDIQSLEKLFDSHWDNQTKTKTGQWTVNLTPTMSAIKQVVEKITLSGEDYVNDLNLDARNGDATRVHFFDINASAYPATEDCQHFDQDASLCPGKKISAFSPNKKAP